ncbi:MAG: hypothetical protein NT075_37015 [Chloroflexi bacterium]|nr:hypothetical protein [Chloroflexota bacterium]
MPIPKATIAHQLAQQLSPYLDFEISQVQSEYQANGSGGSLFKVTVVDRGDNPYHHAKKKA